jgi:hypothetical protein
MRTAVDNLYLYDPQFEAGAKSFLAATGGSSATYAIPSFADLTNALNNFTNVKLVVFDTHGAPGRMWLPDGTNVEGLDFMTINKNTAFLANDARLLFYGCNIAEGRPGDTFLAEVAQNLLRGKGGTVGGTTVSNITFQLGSFSSEAYMMPLSFGRLKVKRYSKQGSEVGSLTVDRHGFRR